MREQAFSVRSAWGSAGREYLAAIKDRIDHVSCIVEIGVDWGYSFYTLARDFPNALVFGIDHFKEMEDGQSAMKHVQEMLPHFKNVKLILAPSQEAYKNWRKPTNFLDIDILHIDGDHSEPGVRFDIEAWGTCVRPGGIIMMHDINNFSHIKTIFEELEGGEKIIVDKQGPGLGIFIKDA